jgi:hypothetical protein
MTDPAKLIELAERVEALTGPCRGTDAWIMGKTDNPQWTDADCEYAAEDADRTCGAPRFTASLNAAKSLMAPGTLWAVGHMEDGPFARLCWPRPDSTFVGGYVETTALTAENALTAACLRAMAGRM